jgi:drug/metabolite transporter (DMT)-like permease
LYYLIFTSWLWAISFGLIKGNLAGLDPGLAALMRLLIAFLLFLPFTRLSLLPGKIIFPLMAVGAVQFGVMYWLYFDAFIYLQAYEVVLFTVFTPLYVTLFQDFLNKRFHGWYFLTAFLSVAGVFLVVYEKLQSTALIKGILLVQASNICFAVGQITYKRITAGIKNVKDYHYFGLLLAGAVLITAIIGIFQIDWPAVKITARHIYTLLYLGVAASGLGFFLWNRGVQRANQGVIAICNNLKIPLGIAASVLLFGEKAPISRLIMGLVIVSFALLLNERLDTGKPQSHPLIKSNHQ